MGTSAAAVYVAEIAKAAADPRPRWRQVVEALVSFVADGSGGFGGHVVAIRLVRDPSTSWLELGPATRREAAGLLKGVRRDLSELSQSEFEHKYRSYHGPSLPDPMIDPWSF